MSQPELDLGLVTVHCFCCPATVEETDPDRAHDAMEEHYAQRHGDLIARIAGEIGNQVDTAAETE